MADECEYCGGVAEVDALINGNYLRVCRKCVNDDMVVVDKPSKEQIDWSYKRPTVKQILSRMSGTRMPAEKGNASVPSMSMLRISSKESEVKKRLTNMKIDSPDQTKTKEKKLNPESLPKSPAASPADIDEEFLDI